MLGRGNPGAPGGYSASHQHSDQLCSHQWWCRGQALEKKRTGPLRTQPVPYGPRSQLAMAQGSDLLATQAPPGPNSFFLWSSPPSFAPTPHTIQSVRILPHLFPHKCRKLETPCLVTAQAQYGRKQQAQGGFPSPTPACCCPGDMTSCGWAGCPQLPTHMGTSEGRIPPLPPACCSLGQAWALLQLCRVSLTPYMESPLLAAALESLALPSGSSKPVLPRTSAET